MQARSPQAVVTDYFQRDAPFWQSVYDGDDVFSVIHRHRAELALRWIDGLALPPGAAVLEIGCGAGLTAVELARRGLRVTATDPTPAMVQLTRARARDAGLDARVEAGIADVHRLPFTDGGFDLVVGLGVLPWLHRPEQGLAEMCRVLRDRGHLLVNVDNRARLVHFVDPLRSPLTSPFRAALRRRWRPGPTAGARAATCWRHRFDRELQRRGMVRVREVTFGFGPFTLLGRRLLADHAAVRVHLVLQHRADRGLPVLRAMGNQYMVLGRKLTRRP